MSIDEARAYAERSHLYLANAASTIRQQRPEKSSEFLWGAMAEALKAVAAIKDIKLRSHDAIRRYARDLAKEREDEQLSTSFKIAQTLHSNFYEGFSDLGEVMDDSARIREAVERLLRLIPPQQGSRTEEGGE
ncbi:MAG: hypothetical protein IH956_03565 [Chloroflexi bacterium]|nr:hypothetical protein [Chloroflexota bacterium]